MERNTFWNLVDISRLGTDGDPEAQAANLVILLDELPLEEIVAFDARFTEANLALNTWDVLGAGTVLLGRLSDDVFTDFRSWIVAQGRQVHERVLADPDSLADVEVSDLEAVGAADDFIDAAHRTYESRTGGDPLPQPADQPTADAAGEPTGQAFDLGDDAELRHRYPRLSARWLAPAGPLPGQLPRDLLTAEQALFAPDEQDDDARPPVSQVLADTVGRYGLSVVFASETSTDPRHRVAHLLTEQGPALLAEVETFTDAAAAVEAVDRSRREHTDALGEGEQVGAVAGLGEDAFRRTGDGISLVRARSGAMVVEVQVSTYLPAADLPSPTADEVAAALLVRFATPA